MNSAEWDKLLSLARILADASDVREALGGLRPDETVFAIQDHPVIEEMMIAAIGRLCDRKGLSLMRIDPEDGQVGVVLSVGISLAHAKLRFVQYVQQLQQD